MIDCARDKTNLDNDPPPLFYELKQMYHQLSRALDIIDNILIWQGKINSGEKIRDRACFAILAADLEALTEECEQYLLLEVEPKYQELFSLQTRGMTVLEEINEMTREGFSLTM